MIQPRARLDFEELGHRYSVGGRRLPSVTQILRREGWSQDWSFLDPWYAERGSAIHEAAALDLLGTLDPDTVDPEVEPFLVNLRRKLEPIGFEPLVIEQRMFDPVLWYAGTPDALGRSTVDDRLVLLDWKATVDHPSNAVQVAGGYLPLIEGYARDELLPVSIEDLRRCRVGICILNNERPIEWIADVRRQRQLFRAALTSYNWKARNNPRSRNHGNSS